MKLIKTNKKILFGGILILMLFSLITVFTNFKIQKAYAATDGDLYFNLIDNGTAYDVSLANFDADIVVIPSTFNGKPVTTIAEYGFTGSTITMACLPESITKIGYYSFYGCTSLETLINPNQGHNQVIDEFAFVDCDLTDIIIPDKVKSLPADVFDSPHGQTRLHLRASSVPSTFSAGWNGNAEIVLSSSYTPGLKIVEQWNEAYVASRQGFSDITQDVEIPLFYNGKPVTYISAMAFSGNAFKSLSIIDNSTSGQLKHKMQIRTNAFLNCSTAGNQGTINLGEYAIFEEANGSPSKGSFVRAGVKTVIIPTDTKVITENMFQGCSMTEIKTPNGQTNFLPAGLTSIMKNAFKRGANAPANDYIVVPASLSVLGETAFADWPVSQKVVFDKQTITPEMIAASGNATVLKLKIGVEYNTDGGTYIQTEYFNIFDKITKLNIASKPGFTFEGWYDSESNGKPSGTLVANKNGDCNIDIFGRKDNFKVYAKYSAITYRITYNMNGAVFNPNISFPTSYSAENGFDYLAIEDEAFLNSPATGYRYFFDRFAVGNGNVGDITVNIKTGPIAYYVRYSWSTAFDRIFCQYDKNYTFSSAVPMKRWIAERNSDGKQWVVSESNPCTLSNLTTVDGDYITLYADNSNCVAEESLITLADGTQKAVENLIGDEQLLVWNMLTGNFDTAPILFIDSDPQRSYEVTNLKFSDETAVKVIDEHAFWDFDLNKYVFLREDAAQYIGHWFNKQIIDVNGNLTWTRVQLVDVSVEWETTTAWSPVTYGHLCYYVNGMLSMPGATEGFINIFEVNGETMKYDEAAYLADIEQYGLFTYEEFSAILPLPEEIFNAFSGQYLKVSIGKGLITWEQIEILIESYSKYF